MSPIPIPSALSAEPPKEDPAFVYKIEATTPVTVRWRDTDDQKRATITVPMSSKVFVNGAEISK